MIRMLHVISPGSGNFGGIEAFLCGYYQFIDRSSIHFDFSFCGKNTMKLKMNDDIFKESEFTEYNVLKHNNNPVHSWIELIKALRTQVKTGKYDIVEIHSASPLIEAMCGIALYGISIKKIAHSHALAEPESNIIKRLIGHICKKIIQHSYDRFFSCSVEAASVFGEKIVSSKKYNVIKNAVQSDKFAYNESIRERVRDVNHIISDEIVIGTVARLSREKNQSFLIDVFVEFHNKQKKSKLWIVGGGDLREDLELYANKVEMGNDVVFFGERNDVNELLQGMDAFLITSFREGLCISAIESQAAGLPTFVSSGVPDECNITKEFHKLSLSQSASEWAEYIHSVLEGHLREYNGNEVINNGYDLRTAMKELESLYCSVIKE